MVREPQGHAHYAAEAEKKADMNVCIEAKDMKGQRGGDYPYNLRNPYRIFTKPCLGGTWGEPITSPIVDREPIQKCVWGPVKYPSLCNP